MKTLSILIFASLILVTLQEGTPEVTSFEIIVAGILGVILLWGISQFLISRNNIPRPLFYLFGFLVWSGVNVVIALTNGVDLLWWLRRFFPIPILSSMALVSMVTFRSQRQLRVAFVILTLIGFIFVFHTFSQIRFVGLEAITNLQDIRGYGGGYYSAFGCCLTAPFLFCRPRLKRLVWLLIICALVVFTLGLILSFTRTYWISTTIAMILMTYLLARVRRVAIAVFFARIAVLALLILALLLCVAPTNISGFVISRVTSISQAKDDLSFVDRISELQGLWDSATANPITLIIGNGLGAKFAFYSSNPFSWGGVGYMENDYSHNYYAYLFWSTGIIGLFLFLFFWASLLWQMIKTLCNTSNTSLKVPYYLIGIYTATVNLLIASLTGSPLMGFKWAVYFGILIGIALNLMKLQQITNKLSQ